MQFSLWINHATDVIEINTINELITTFYRTVTLCYNFAVIWSLDSSAKQHSCKISRIPLGWLSCVLNPPKVKCGITLAAALYKCVSIIVANPKAPKKLCSLDTATLRDTICQNSHRADRQCDRAGSVRDDWPRLKNLLKQKALDTHGLSTEREVAADRYCLSRGQAEEAP